jgi:FkbM family methyltransferase
MNLYRIKRTLLAPYVWYKRRQFRHLTGFGKAALELHYYRPSMFRFIGATMVNPDILHDAPIAQGAVVVDVGGYTGEWAQKICDRYAPQLYSFELDPHSFRKLQQRFAGQPTARCFDYGLAGADARLRLLQKGLGSTLYSEAGDDLENNAQASGSVEVEVRDIVAVFDELGLRNVDLLKLNIEGGEYDVLERLLDADRMKDVDCLMVQFHEWLDRATWRRFRIRQRLRRTHREVWNYPFVWEQWVRK